MILVTGGAGFIGSNFICDWVANTNEGVINLDKLTYAGNLLNLDHCATTPSYRFVKADIGDRQTIKEILSTFKPRAVLNFAAESHVDRSINHAEDFISTNIVGTYRLLEEVTEYHNRLTAQENEQFRFLHISTDEVYGTLGPSDPAFTEQHPYDPTSPYAATKAASDHLVTAWHKTYGLPTLITNCSNNYGPLQFPEKLIPLMITRALKNETLPIYGNGQQVRDWLYVADHVSALKKVLEGGRVGEKYNIGGQNEEQNINLVTALCTILDERSPRKGGGSYKDQITFVADRPAHDCRYAIDANKIRTELGWAPTTSLQQGLGLTVKWYLDHLEWVECIQSGAYIEWMHKQYGT